MAIETLNGATRHDKAPAAIPADKVRDLEGLSACLTFLSTNRGTTEDDALWFLGGHVDRLIGGDTAALAFGTPGVDSKLMEIQTAAALLRILSKRVVETHEQVALKFIARKLTKAIEALTPIVAEMDNKLLRQAEEAEAPAEEEEEPDHLN